VLLDLADADRRCITAGLLGRGRQVGERGVGRAVGIEVQGRGILGTQALEQVLRSEGASSGSARLDRRCLIDLVAERGDFGPARRGYGTDVERGAPVQAEAQHDLLGLEVAAGSDVLQSRSQAARGGDAAPRCN